MTRAALTLVLAVVTSALPQIPHGIVSGIVVTDESPAQPVRRATVSFISPDLRVPLSTVTDDAGRFMLEDVPSGYYSVAASKPAYVGAFYGSKRPGRGPGVPVAVPAGGRVADLRLTLTRGSVVTGMLRLPSGLPAHNMPIVAAEIETVGGVRRLRLAGGRTTTDDRGEYRVFGLPPGEYLIQARPSGLLSGALTGASDARQTTAAEVSWAQEAARGRPGPILAGPQAREPERGRTMNYATVYFPGTPNPALAVPVRVGPGEERRGADFALVLVPTAKVSGLVLDSSGQPMPTASVALRPIEQSPSVASLVASGPAVQSGADGSFSIPAVAPGSYQLVARSAPDGIDLWALQDLLVDGSDLSHLVLGLQPGMTVSGRLVFAATSRRVPEGDELTQARVTLTPVSSGGAADAVVSGPSSASSSVAADGTFVVTGLMPDAYRMSVTMPGLRRSPLAPGDGWSLVSIMHGTVDVADQALDIRPAESLDGIVATLTDRPTELVGMLSDQDGRPAPGYPIVVFSTDRRHWAPGSRRTAVARPSTDGTFRLVGLPPGTYYLSAVVSLDPSDVEDPAYLEQLVAGALTITLVEGVLVTRNLRLASGAGDGIGDVASVATSRQPPRTRR